MKLKTYISRRLLRLQGRLNYLGLDVAISDDLMDDQVLDALRKRQYERPEIFAAMSLVRLNDRVGLYLIFQPSGRERVLAYMRKTLVMRQGYPSFPFAMVDLYNYPLMKKSLEPVSSAWRKQYLAAVAAGTIDAPPRSIESEILGTAS
jgi:hypothetical protein